jgi:hypothetical protein
MPDERSQKIKRFVILIIYIYVMIYYLLYIYIRNDYFYVILIIYIYVYNYLLFTREPYGSRAPRRLGGVDVYLTQNHT